MSFPKTKIWLSFEMDAKDETAGLSVIHDTHITEQHELKVLA